MKTFAKLVLTSLALWLFSLVGWIDIVWKPLLADQILNQILVLFILSLIIGLGMFVMTTFYMTFFIPFGTGISFLLLFLAGTGFFLFWFIQQALPGWVFVDVGFWGTLLMSFVLGMIWFSNNKRDY